MTEPRTELRKRGPRRNAREALGFGLYTITYTTRRRFLPWRHVTHIYAKETTKRAADAMVAQLLALGVENATITFEDITSRPLRASSEQEDTE